MTDRDRVTIGICLGVIIGLLLILVLGGTT